jgi:hypothetical protein
MKFGVRLSEALVSHQHLYPLKSMWVFLLQ